MFVAILLVAFANSPSKDVEVVEMIDRIVLNVWGTGDYQKCVLFFGLDGHVREWIWKNELQSKEPVWSRDHLGNFVMWVEQRGLKIVIVYKIYYKHMMIAYTDKDLELYLRGQRDVSLRWRFGEARPSWAR